MIQVKNLTKFYGIFPAIQNVTFDVVQGEILGFLGPNAAGKTTTMRILTGYMPPTNGTVKIAGYDVVHEPIEVKRLIGYMPENVPLHREMTVQKFLHFVATIKGVSSREIPKELDRVIERCGLSEVRKRVIQHLSKGYRQRVGLAQALIGSPPVLVLDEPTVGLDPRQIIDIRNMIRALADSHTILLSSHVLHEVSMICSRVVVIHQGRIVAEHSLKGEMTDSQEIVFDIETAAPARQVCEKISKLPGIAKATPGVGGHLTVTTTSGMDPRRELIQSIEEARLGLLSLSPRKKSLEEVFISAISEENEAV